MARWIGLLTLQNFVDVSFAMQNAHDTQGAGMDDVKDQEVFKALYGPGAQAGEKRILEMLWRTGLWHLADQLDGFVYGF